MDHVIPLSRYLKLFPFLLHEANDAKGPKDCSYHVIKESNVLRFYDYSCAHDIYV
jgi:hypothetical protein